MKDDIIEKISSSAIKPLELREADVRSMMILIRKLLDTMPQAESENYLILRLYCNWTAHIQITKSNTGLRILAEVNDTLVNVKNSKDGNEVINKLSQSIGYPSLRRELFTLFEYVGIDHSLFTSNESWAHFLVILIEIIKDVPLSFPPLSTLDAKKQKIYNKIAANPIKPGAGVVAIQISEIENKIFGENNAGSKLCLIIKTEDTTSTVVPLGIDASL